MSGTGSGIGQRRRTLPLREDSLGHLADRATEERWTPQRIVHNVRQVMPADGTAAQDNGMYKIWFAQLPHPRRQHPMLDNALTPMGAGLPQAIMVAMLYPKRRVLAACGGGVMMNSQEFEPAVRRKLDLVVLVLIDKALGMIRWKQAMDGFPDFGMTFGEPDSARYAHAYGVQGRYLTDNAELERALAAAFQAGGVHFSQCRSTTMARKCLWQAKVAAHSPWQSWNSCIAIAASCI